MKTGACTETDVVLVSTTRWIWDGETWVDKAQESNDVCKVKDKQLKTRPPTGTRRRKSVVPLRRREKIPK